jgi:oligoribonuclease
MKLYWLDLETSGLDPLQNSILEIAIAESDLLTPFEIGPVTNIVLHHPFLAVDRRTSYPIDQKVVEMHTKNGLWYECSMSQRFLSDVEEELLTLVPLIEDYEEKPSLAGACAHFDHAFLKQWMPRLARRFTSRHYDVSSIKLFCRSLGMEKPIKGEAHRAKADILESIEHAKLCKEWLHSNMCRIGQHIHTSVSPDFIDEYGARR